MLRTSKDLEHYLVLASDGEIGQLKDLYFDDQDWVIRYLVVNAGSWLSSRQVLISPISIRETDWLDHSLRLSITKEQVKHSPERDTALPVSRQYEAQYLGYYGYPHYWGGGSIWADGAFPYAMVPGYFAESPDRGIRQIKHRYPSRVSQGGAPQDDPHLRSCAAVAGYHLEVTDGEIGHVSGYLIDDATWVIRYLVVETSNWWMGHKVLIAPEWITAVKWSEETVSVDLSRDAVQHAPAYDPETINEAEFDEQIYRHYGRSSVWSDDELLEDQS